MMLGDRSTIEVLGGDRKLIFEKLATNIVSDGITYSCILTPNGRFMYDFFIHCIEDKLYIDIHSEWSESFIKLLEKYRFKMDYSLQPVQDLAVFFNDSSSSDPRNLGFGRFIGMKQGKDSAHAYHKLRIEKGIPEGFYDLKQERSIILEYGFDSLNAVSFTKGCYLGQELISRTKHTGTVRKKVFKMNGESLPNKGDAIFQNGIECGEMLSSMESCGLALLRFDDVNLSETFMSDSGTEITISGSYFE